MSKVTARVNSLNVSNKLQGVLPIDATCPIYAYYEDDNPQKKEEDIYCMRYRVSKPMTDRIRYGMEELQKSIKINQEHTDSIRLGTFRAIVNSDGNMHFFKCNLEDYGISSGLIDSNTMKNSTFLFLSSQSFFKDLIITTLQKHMIDVLLRMKEKKHITCDEVFAIDAYFQRKVDMIGWHKDEPDDPNQYTVDNFSLLYLIDDPNVVIKSASLMIDQITKPDDERYVCNTLTFNATDRTTIVVNNRLVHTTPRRESDYSVNKAGTKYKQLFPTVFERPSREARKTH